jgi:hypothetical protein
MAEPVLLNLDHHLAKKMDRLARAGNPEGLEFFARLFDGYDNLPCFLCDREVDERPVFCQVPPEITGHNKVLVVPLCSEHRQMPGQQRLGRCFKVLKAMHNKRGGKQLHFTLRRR